MKHKASIFKQYLFSQLLLDVCCYPNFKLLTLLKGASGCVGEINGISIKMFGVERKKTDHFLSRINDR